MFIRAFYCLLYNILCIWSFVGVLLRKNIFIFQHKRMALTSIPKRFMSSAVQRLVYNLSGFNKYGLWRDDLIDDSDQDVNEALKRVDEKTIDERNYRILRAIQLSLQKDILPKDQWTKLENDKLYLTPIIKQVRKEREEREEWNKKY